MGTVTPHTSWHDRAARLRPCADALIDGELVESRSGRRFAKSSPVDGRFLASVAEGDAPDVDAAVSAARRAFEAGVWASTAPRDRRRAMLDWARAIVARREELALLVTLEVGKPIRDALSEVDYTAEVIEFYAEAIDKTYGEIAPSGQDALPLVTREPMGVVGLVIPWNFPLSMAAWKLGPALATGNSAVVKPAEQSPLSALELARLALESDIPPGVLNVVPGFGETAGAALGRHLDVDKVSFTGSSAVGKLFLSYAGESNMKAVSLECGGKSPNIVLADAPDLEAAAAAAAAAVCLNSGQMCNAGSRLLVERSIRDDFAALVAEEMKGWQPGDPLDIETRMGAVVDEIQLGRILDFIAAGVEEGAELRLGGGRALRETGGSYVEPALLTNVDNAMTIACEEIFGPVLATIDVDDPAHAVRVANDSRYGLAAAVWTRDLTRAHRVARALRAGTVYVNCYDTSDINVTFGGYGESGIGVDKSLHAMEKYTRFKTTWIDLQR